MEIIKTQSDIHVFVDKLIQAGIEIPINLQIRIKLTQRQFNKIVPEDYRHVNNLEYNGAGLKVFLDNPQKTNNNPNHNQL